MLIMKLPAMEKLSLEAVDNGREVSSKLLSVLKEGHKRPEKAMARLAYLTTKTPSCGQQEVDRAAGPRTTQQFCLFGVNVSKIPRRLRTERGRSGALHGTA